MLFFFYGTLLDGSDNPVARDVHALLEPLGPANVAGSLMAVADPDGWYPALLPGDGLIHGKLYRSRPGFGAAELARLDAYEDYYPDRPAQSLYLRRTVIASLDGADVEAEAYLFNRTPPEGSEPIPQGDFREWLGRSGVTPFAGRRSEG